MPKPKGKDKGGRSKNEEEDEDFDAILLQAQKKRVQAKEIKIHQNCSPPTPRVNACFVADPIRSNLLILFGGEYFNGDKTFCYNDTFTYDITSGTWTHLTDPSAPPPRCSHQGVVHNHHLYIYGGEYTSPNQAKFHHYSDTWRLDLQSGKWEELKLKTAPKGRSGHRMVLWKDTICMFGGFQDTTGDAAKYLNDFYLLEGLNGANPKWKKTAMVPGEERPAPRSGPCLAVHEDMMFLFGGFSAGHGPWNDLWAYHFSSGFWRSLQPTGIPPSVRSGMVAAAWQGKSYLFGGVCDMNTAKAKGSTFYNEMFVLDLAERRWVDAAAAFPAAKLEKCKLTSACKLSGSPCPRMNAMMAVQGGVLYVYGGMWEEKKREWTATDLFALPLQGPAEWKTLVTMDPSAQQWLGEVEEDSSDEEEEEEGNEEEEEDGDGCFGDQFDASMLVPDRLASKAAECIRNAHREYFLAAADTDSLQSYQGALAKVINQQSVVLQLPTGSGLLAMLSARAGAARVFTIEDQQDVADVARKVIIDNGLQGRVAVYDSDLSGIDVGSFPQQPSVVIADLFGPLLLSKGLLHAIADARTRILAPNAIVMPAAGEQFATLIQSSELHCLSSAAGFSNLKMGAFNELQNTASPLLTNELGFRFADVSFAALGPKIPILHINLQKDGPAAIPRESRHPVQVTQDGVIHAVLLTWEIWLDPEGEFRVSTEPEATKGNLARDMRWGQAFQLIEQDPNAPLPSSPSVKTGDTVTLVVRLSSDLKNLQVAIECTA